MTDYINTEVLVIGCGIAGGVAALQLADAGVPVTVITRARQPQESNTYYAQGGIIYKGSNDSPELLIEDVTRAGAGLCNLKSVEILAEQGPELVEDILLHRIGVRFDKNGRALSLAREGGHSLPRIIHAADATGKAIAIALIKALHDHPKVALLSGYSAVDLIMADQHQPDGVSIEAPPACLGAYLLDQTRGQVMICRAKATILATGGLGQVFSRTSNPAGARGDGVAIAHRAGAQIINMEFVQFHPTTFYHPTAPSFLISEAVRGAGACLVNVDGEPFMQRYAPEWKDLAPRDVVARSIQQEMTKWGVPNVYLDLRSYISTDEIRSHFPTIYDYCLTYGVDISCDLVPVAPAAHYACGGISVNQWGQTTVDRLYAIGEVACTGLHGANRLASTSLLEGLVWGCRAAAQILSNSTTQTDPTDAMALFDTFDGAESVNISQVNQIKDTIRQLMWDQVGLVRTTPGLEDALCQLRQLEAEIDVCYQRSQFAEEIMGLRNMVQVARLITTAALENGVSLGCHYRIQEDTDATPLPWRITSLEPAMAG